jgi:dolichyl-diphosphooligosaccharide--protein glycosyltransferase
MKTIQTRRSERLITVIVLLAISYAFLHLCFLNYSGIVFERELRLYGTDPYYNARRIWLTALHYPRLLEYDSYVNFPTGAHINIPPGFHYLLATICRTLLGQAPTLYEAGRVSVIVTPLLGLLTVGTAALAGLRWFGPRTALLSAFFSAINPFMLQTSRVGRVDYHMLEPFFLILIFYLFERAYSSGRTNKALFCGLAVTLSFFFVPVANIFPFVFIGFVFLKGTIDMFRRRFDEKMAETSGKTLLWALIFSLPLSMTTHFARTGSFAVEPVSLFQPTMLLCAFIVNAVFHKTASTIVRKGVSLRISVLPALGLAALAAALVQVPPVKEALMFLVKGDPIASSIRESQSIIVYGVGDFIKEVPSLVVVLGLVILVVYRAKREFNFLPLLIAYLLIATTVLGIIQLRLFHLLVPVYGIALSNLLDKGVGFASGKMKKRLSSGMLAAAPIVLAFAVLSGINYPALRSFARFEREYISPGMKSLSMVFDSLLWLRENTPKTAYLTNPSKKPQYGVMASWVYGHYIVFYAKRPNIANPISFGGTHREGILNVSRFFSEKREDSAVSLCRKLGVRYILVDEQDLETHMDYLGILGDGAPLSSDGYFSTMGSRLYYLNGSAMNIQGVDVEALGNFRLVYESKHDMAGLKVNLDRKLSASKVFEFVKGVKIHGKTAPNSAVSAKSPILTNRGRQFQYHMITRSDANGYYEFYLPYSNTGNPYETGAEGPYSISSAGKSVEATISEDEILAGGSREINFIQTRLPDS